METFSVASNTIPGIYYTVWLDGDEWDCQCTAASYRRLCSHVKLARELRDAEQRIMTENKPSNIHEAIAAIYGQVGYVQKQRTQGLNYSYASEQALIEALRPAMVEHGVYVYVGQIGNLTAETYTTSKGAVMNMCRLIATVHFIHAPSGTGLEVQAVGEGSDSGDKAANKAMTAAYKYALRQTFCIETGDDPDRTPSEEQERATANRAQSNGNRAHVDTKRLSQMLAEDGVEDKSTAIASVTGDAPGSLTTQKAVAHAVELWALNNGINADIETAFMEAVNAQREEMVGHAGNA